MMEAGFSRRDCVVAVGGGVVGDLSGFAASCYMRGIDFYNVPTTVLSQVDSSVGGKTGVNLDHIKNIVGAFKQPKGVIADLDLLKSLPKRQVSNGLSEAVKMALTFDSELFSLFETTEYEDKLEEIIARSIALKIAVVEQDEKEAGLRKVLNFGHTIGHGIESLGLGYYHGECVALGMLYMCSDSVKARLKSILEKYEIPMAEKISEKELIKYISVDKKANGSKITIIYVESLGSFEMRDIEIKDICDYINGGAK
jgi:3-dehydroquinate synthase